MDLTAAKQTLADVEELYKATMELYQNYFEMLKVAIQNTPETEVDKLNKLNALAKEGEESLQSDMAVFDKALATDTESLTGIQDELKIQSIYNKLK